MRLDAERLHDILDAIAAIHRYTAAGRSEFDRDERTRVWCAHHIAIIGEAAARLSNELKQAHSDVPWREMAAMRNILIHEYFGADWNEIWNVIEHDLQPLERRIRAVVDSLDQKPDVP